MRTIKFRAWTGKQMIYQDKQYLASFIRRVVPQIILDHGGETFSQHESYLPNGGVIDEYLMQFTGLKDKNDKEIYEGDILQEIFMDKPLAESFWQVGYEQGAFGVYCPPVAVAVELPFQTFFDNFEDLERFEIIGNIYETPELLHKS